MRGKQRAYLEKSLQELEKENWGPVGGGETRLIRDCLRLRKIPLAQLTDNDLRLLIGQQIGLKHLVPPALERLKADPWLESLYPGDLLAAILGVGFDFWRAEPALLSSALDIARSAVDSWERLEGGPRSLTGFRHVKRLLSDLEDKTHEKA
jgi:hypothetical protein